MRVVDNAGLEAIEIGDVNEIILVVGKSGSGKSVFVNNCASSLKHYLDYKVVYLTEKKDSKMENAFCAIESKNERQLKMLKDDGQLLDSKTVKQEKVEILVPFSFNLPVNDVPDIIKVFTLPLREIHDKTFSALLNRDSDSPATVLCKEVKLDLKPSDDIYAFLFRAFEKTSSFLDKGDVKVVQSDRIEDMGIPIESYGSKREMEVIKHSFRKLTENYIIQEDKCDLNLNNDKMEKLLNDNDTTTVFSLWNIEDEKLIYFIYLELLLKIHDVVIQGKLKHPLLLVFEEIKILLPTSTQTGYILEFIEEIIKILAGARSSGFTAIATTQSYYETHPKFRDAISQIMLFSVSAEDQKSFTRDFNLSSTNQSVLSSLERGECVLFNQISKKEYEATKFRAYHVPFAHREEGMPHFWTHWKHCYPDRITNFRALISEMKIKQKEAFDEQLKRRDKLVEEKKPKVKEEIEETQEVEEDLSQLSHNDRLKKDLLTPKGRGRPKTVKKPKENLIDESSDQTFEFKCYDYTKATAESSWEDRLFLFDNKTAEEVEKGAVQFALLKKDFGFIRKFSSKEFVLKTFNYDIDKKDGE